MLGQRLRRWPSIEQTLLERLVFAGKTVCVGLAFHGQPKLFLFFLLKIRKKYALLVESKFMFDIPQIL